MISKRSLFVLMGGWLFAVCFLIVRGRADAVTIGTDIVWPMIVFFLSWLTTRIAPQPEPVPKPREKARNLVAQLVIIFGIIILTGLRGLSAQGGIAIPGWSPLLALFGAAGARIGMSNDVTNFGAYVIIPGVLVCLLGAKFSEMGFARFAPRITAVSALWLAFPAILWAFAIASGRASLSFMVFQLVRNSLSNGFSEEFLWRGLLLSRLRAFISTEFALWAQAVFFGLWHFGYDYRSTPNHDLALMFADMFSSQVVLGFAFGWLTLRTRNIALPAAVHLAFDSLGDAFGAK